MDPALLILIGRQINRRRREDRLRDIRRNSLRLRRLRDLSNPFELPEATFVGKYRLSRQLARDLCEELRPYMRTTERATAIPLHLRILGVLHFFGHGSDQKGIASDEHSTMSQASVSLSIEEVVNALNTPVMLQSNIKFPDSAEERRSLIHRNYQRSRIPGVLGYIDGAHIMIVAPNVHEEQYVNRHGTHSLNVQITCDCDMVILNILARYPGSTHDSFIWANSAIRAKMESLYLGGEPCWLLGDSGYANEPWLHVPINDAAPGSRESNFNQALMIDRSVVERTIGHLRNRFRCLSKHRVLEYSPMKAGKIANACAILHNKCVRANVPVPMEQALDEEDLPPLPPLVVDGRRRDRLLTEGRQVRAQLVSKVPPLPPRQIFNPHRRHRRGEQAI